MRNVGYNLIPWLRLGWNLDLRVREGFLVVSIFKWQIKGEGVTRRKEEYYFRWKDQNEQKPMDERHWCNIPSG